MAEISAVRIAMMRDLYDGAPVTIEALSIISGKKKEFVEELSMKWKENDDLHNQKSVGRIKKNKLKHSITPKKQYLDKSSCSLKLGMQEKSIPKTKRIQEIENDYNTFKEREQINEDEDLASLLQRIDDRIVELAQHYAKHLVAEEHKKISGQKSDSGMVRFSPDESISSSV